MDQQEMKIIPPEGYEVDKENSTFECVRFKQIEPHLPKTWKEFCNTLECTKMIKIFYLQKNMQKLC